MKNTILQSALFTILFIVSGLFSNVVAQDFAGGAGTEGDPYQVETAEQLDGVRNYLNSHFIQIADIDLGVSPWSDGEGWEPIGTEGDAFEGTLIGNGHTISNLFIDQNTGNAGLFGFIGEIGQVSGIRIMNANITSSGERSGILAGYLDGVVSNTEVSGIVSGNARVGGLAGAAELNSTITKVSADITITSTNERAGGLLGSNRGDISHSYAHGTVTGSARVGGLIGNGYSGTVSNNYVAVELTGGGWTRGLVGDRAGGSYIDNFVDEDVANTASSGEGIFRSTEDLTTFKTYTEVGWDFDTIWGFNHEENNSYPFLKFQDHYTHSLREIADLATLSVTGDIDDITTFDVNTTNYELKVKNEVTSVDVSFSSQNGSTVDSESPQAIHLTNGNGSFSIEVTAEDQTTTKVYTISISPYFQSGTGTEANPYQVETADQLNSVRNYLDAHYIQTADIDLGVSPWSDGDGWEPIGENGNAFTGTFDGQVRTISGLTINRSTDYVGLFGYTYTGAIIQNLGLINVSIRGRNTVGGLVGYLLDGTVSNSYVVGQVNQNTNSGDDIGGLAGRSAGTITDSYVDVIVGGSSRVGGLVGQNEGVIEGSYALGAMLGSNRLGGFVGSNGLTGTISNSYSSVDVSSNYYNQDIFGGLVGQNSGAINNSYANGIMVVNQNSAGGLIGHNSGAVNGSFWDTETSGQIRSSGGTGKTTTEMKTKSTFADAEWDFDTIWQIGEPQDSNNSYPYLQSNTQDPAPGYIEPQSPEVVTHTTENITSKSATLSGNVTADGGDTLTERGFVYSLTADNSTPTVAESSGSDVTKVVVSGTTGVFNETISGLSASSQYSFAAYAINSVGTSYGSVEQFSTVNNPISEYSSGTNTLPDTRFFGIQFTTPNTDPAYSMTGFTFLDNTGSNPVGAGKVYVFTSSPSGLLTPSDLPTYTVDLLGISDTWNGSVYGFSGGLNLDANTTYWVLTDTDGFEVGNDFSNPNNAIYAISSSNNYVNQLQTINYQVTGIAVSVPPTVNTTAASGITPTSAILGGNVADVGGAVVTDRGIAWSTTSEPDVNDNKVEIGDGTGDFSTTVDLLPFGTEIFYRAYAVNDEGTAYGDEESFTTNDTVSAELTGDEGWRMLSVPAQISLEDFLAPIWTQGVTTGGDAENGEPNVYTWDYTSTYQDENDSSEQWWQEVTDLTNTTLSAGQGVLVKVFEDDDYQSQGVAGGFPKSLPITGSEFLSANPALNTNEDGWTLLGNPFSVPVTWGQLDLSGIKDAIYIWDPNNDAGEGQDTGSWKTHSGGAGDLNGTIAPFQGFFVQTDGTATPSVSFTQEHKTTDAAPFLGKQAQSDSIVRLEMQGQGMSNSAWLRFSPDGQTEETTGDAWQLTPLATNYVLLATQKENQLFDIGHYPSGGDVEIPVITETTRTGNYTLTVTDFSGGMELFLKDLQNGQSLRLEEGTRYEFTLNHTAKIPADPFFNLSERLQKTGVNEHRFTITTSPKTVEEDSDLPNSITLNQNYPNPFNPTTTISYELPESNRVQLHVYDLTGRQIATLVDGQVSAGVHRINFDASNLSSGVYIYRLTAGVQQFTRRLTLVK